MSSTTYSVRRATLDDLPTLRPIWESLRLPVADLEKRLTEFQVAVDADKKIVGVIAFQIADRHARIHSEAFSDFAIADTLRPLFWKRFEALAINHGIARLWTQEQSPFWKQNGLNAATAEDLKKFPPAWGRPTPEWLTLRLKDEEAVLSIEKEFDLYMQAEKQRSEDTLGTARALNKIATAIAIVLVVCILGAVFYLYIWRRSRGLTPAP
jgi:hypothetical protein